MAKWYVEYKIKGLKPYTEHGYMGGIEAEDGKAAIEYAKKHGPIWAYDFEVWRDDEEGGAEV